MKLQTRDSVTWELRERGRLAVVRARRAVAHKRRRRRKERCAFVAEERARVTKRYIVSSYKKCFTKFKQAQYRAARAATGVLVRSAAQGAP